MRKRGGSVDTDWFAAGVIVGKGGGDVKLRLIGVVGGEVDGGGGKFTGPVGSDLGSEVKRNRRARGRIIIGKGDIVGEFFSRFAGLGVGNEGESG